MDRWEAEPEGGQTVFLQLSLGVFLFFSVPFLCLSGLQFHQQPSRDTLTKYGEPQRVDRTRVGWGFCRNDAAPLWWIDAPVLAGIDRKMYKITAIIRAWYYFNSYLWLTYTGNLRRAKPWSLAVTFSASTSLMNFFGFVIGSLTAGLAFMLLTLRAALRLAAETLYAVKLILALTDIAYELNREFFSWGWEHQHSLALLWSNDDLTVGSSLRSAGRWFRPLHI